MSHGSAALMILTIEPLTRGAISSTEFIGNRVKI
jgi:hypothetical protein